MDPLPNVVAVEPLSDERKVMTFRDRDKLRDVVFGLAASPGAGSGLTPRGRAARAAEKKANELLESLLDPAQLADWRATGTFWVDSRRQLVIYHFMWLWDEGQGCPSCSFLVDSMPHVSHLHARDTGLVVVSRGKWPDIDAYRERMGWTMPWYSSFGSDFNYDFHVTIDEKVAPVEYNYKTAAELERQNVAWRGWSGEQPGTSAFLRDGDRVFHTYSSYARAGDILINTYNYLDLTALGRQEDWEEPKGRSDGPMMHWLRRHDEYDEA